MKRTIYKTVIRLLVRPFSWANRQKKQTIVTRAIRATWHKL